MRWYKFILIFFFIQLFNVGVTQNWQTIISEKEYYFDVSNTSWLDIYSFQADSLIIDGLDTSYFNYKQLGTNNFIFMGACRSYSDTTLLGTKVMCKSNGINLFFNQKGDTILIKTRAEKDSSWVFFKDTASHYFEAKIISKELTSFGDSLKTILIRYKDSLGSITNHIFDSSIIKITKNEGFLELFEFMDFPYNLIERELTSIHQNNFGAKEIFDFNLGDVFHYSYNDSYGEISNGLSIGTTINTYWTHEIVYKNTSTNEDTIVMKYSRKHLNETRIDTMNYGYDIELVIKIDTIIETIILSELDVLNKNPNEVFNGYFIVLDDDTKTLYDNHEFLDTTESFVCSYPDFCMDGGGSNSISYKKGIGMTNKYNCSSNSVEKLIYYKKTTGEEWGTPIPDWRFTDIDETNANSTDGFGIKVYPNPAADILNIEGESIDKIYIYNQLGQQQKIIINNSTSISIQLDISALPKGIYLLSVNNRVSKLFHH